MPYKSDVYDDDDWQEEDDDDEDDSDDGYIPCPHCGATMLEAADYCPGCQRWITSEDLPEKRRPWWIVAVILTLIVVMIMAILPR